MSRRTYHFIEYLGPSKKLSISHLTSSKKEIERRAEQCKKNKYPYRIINRLTSEVIEEWEPEFRS